MSKLIEVSGYTFPADFVESIGPLQRQLIACGARGVISRGWEFQVDLKNGRSRKVYAGDCELDYLRKRRDNLIAEVWPEQPTQGGQSGAPLRNAVPAEWAETKDGLLNDALHRAAMKSVAEGLPTRSLLGDTNPKPAPAGATGYEPDDDPLPDLAWPEGDRTEDLMPSIRRMDDLPEPTELW